PGLGPETVDAILLYAAGRPVFVADAYARRVLARHRLLARTADYETAREFVQAHLPSDPALFNELHALLVAVSKTYCRAIPLCGVGHGEGAGSLAHVFQPRRLGEQRLDALEQQQRRHRGLGQDRAAARALDEPRVRRLLVAGGARQRDVERGHAELAALVDGAGAGATDDERGRRVDVGQLVADPGAEGVARGERGCQRRAPRLQPRAVARRPVVARLVQALRVRQQIGEHLADGAVDRVRALRAAGHVDERQDGIEPEALERGRAAAAAQLGPQ